MSGTVPRMRTLPEAVALLRELDPHTAVTLRALRRMAASGELPLVHVASKRLVNFDMLLERLADTGAAAPAVQRGVIRRIDGR